MLPSVDWQSPFHSGRLLRNCHDGLNTLQAKFVQGPREVHIEGMFPYQLMAKAVHARQQVAARRQHPTMACSRVGTTQNTALQVSYMQLAKSAGALSHIVQVHAFGTQRSETDVGNGLLNLG